MFIYILSPPFSLPFPRNFFPKQRACSQAITTLGLMPLKLGPVCTVTKKNEFGICKKFENFVIVSSRLEPCLHL